MFSPGAKRSHLEPDITDRSYVRCAERRLATVPNKYVIYCKTQSREALQELQLRAAPLELKSKSPRRPLI